MGTGRRLANAAYVAVTLVLAAAVVAELWFFWSYLGAQRALGADLTFFQDAARRWIDTGEFYLERQLAGPYVVETLVDVLYPPVSLYLFVPFLVLPAVLWWAIPIALFAVCVVRLRPARWSWPLIAFGIAWPPSVSQVLYGNTNMWVAAAIAAGTCWAWPSVLVLLKPSLAPFALIGVGRRRWWIALAILGVASVPFGSLWLDYVVAIRNSSLTGVHAIGTLPLMLVPLAAWLGRRRPLGAGGLQPDASTEAVPDVDDVAVAQVE